MYAVKETVEDIAFREYRLLRDLQRLDLPAVVPQGVVTGRVDADGEELPSALLTEHLRFSLPYRSLFSHGLAHDSLPSLVDALVVLLVRLHLADFFWGDVSLSNVLFRRSAGGFAAYLVDAETGELRPSLSPSMREYDLTIATENVFAELLDLQASESLSYEVEAARHRRAARVPLPRAVGGAHRRGGVLAPTRCGGSSSGSSSSTTSASTSTSSTSSPTSTATRSGSSPRSSRPATTSASCRG